MSTDANEILAKLCRCCGLPGVDPAAELSTYIQELQESKQSLDKELAKTREHLLTTDAVMRSTCAKAGELDRELMFVRRREKKLGTVLKNLARGLRAAWFIHETKLADEDGEYEHHHEPEPEMTEALRKLLR